MAKERIVGKAQATWTRTKSLMSNPWGTIKEAHNKSPITVLLAVVFLLQPIVSLAISIVGDYTWVRQKLDPNLRPVTVSEFQLLDQQVDAVQATLVDVGKKIDAIQKVSIAPKPQIRRAIPIEPPTAGIHWGAGCTQDCYDAQTAAPAPTVEVPKDLAVHVAAYDDTKKKLAVLQDKLAIEYMTKKPKL